MILVNANNKDCSLPLQIYCLFVQDLNLVMEIMVTCLPNAGLEKSPVLARIQTSHPLTSKQDKQKVSQAECESSSPKGQVGNSS